MSSLRILAAAAALSLSLAPASFAATAHNSQAGSWGPNSHQCAPTPYFREGGCLSTFVEDYGAGSLGSPRRVLRDGTDPYYRTLPPPAGY